MLSVVPFLPIRKAGGACHNQAPIVADNVFSEMILGYPARDYDRKVQAIAQMGLNAGMPLCYGYRNDLLPRLPTKVGVCYAAALTAVFIGQWCVA